MKKHLHLIIVVCFIVSCKPNYLEKDNQAEVEEMIMDFYVKYGIKEYTPTYFSEPIGKQTISDANYNTTAIKYSIGHKFRGYSSYDSGNESSMLGRDVWYVTITKDSISLSSQNYSKEKVLDK